METKIDENIKFIEHIPVTQVLELIKNGVKPIYEHTNLQSCKRSKIEIAEIMACNAQYNESEKPKYPSVQSLITYPIERIVYFDTIATIETELQCGEEHDLYKYVDFIYKEVSNIEFKAYEQAIDEKAKLTAQKAFTALSNQEKLDDPSWIKYKEAYERIQTAFESGQYTVSQKFLNKHHIKLEEAFPLLVKMTIEDIVYKEEMNQCLNDLITPKIKEVIDKAIEDEIQFPIHDPKGAVIRSGILQKLSLHEGEDRVTFMMAGAPASGKGTILVKILDEAEKKKGINERDMVKINTDTHRLLVCKGCQEKLGVNKEFHVSLNNDEASYITLMGYEKMRQKINQNNAPHMLIDGVTLGNDRIQLGTQNNGKLEISIITVDAESSIKRAQQRGEATGRYVQTSYLINSHRDVTVSTYDMLINRQLMGTRNIQVSIYDNNVPQGTQPVHVAWIDMKDKKAEIYEAEKLAEFRGKRHITSVQNREQFLNHSRKRNLSMTSNDILSETGYNVSDEKKEELRVHK